MKRIFALILFVLLSASIALAADKTAYIRTDCANNGNGTSASCAASNGAAGAYKTCAQAITGEVAANANLTTLGGNLILDAAGTTADGQCVIDGFSGMDSSHVVRLKGDLVGGVYSGSYYRLFGTPNGGLIDVRDPYVEIDRVQVRNNDTSSGNTWGIYCGESLGGLSLKVTNSIIRGNSGSGGPPAGIYFRPDVANARGIFINNTIYGFTNASAIGFTLYGSGYNNGESIIAYNNTCHGSPICYATHGGGSSDAQYIKNNAAQSCSTCYSLDAASSHSTSTTATNLSEDTSSPQSGLRSKVMTFVSETGGSEDLHITSGDTVAKDAGTDLSGDAQYAFSTDIDGSTRSGTWDIGADEYISAGSAVPALVAGGL